MGDAYVGLGDRVIVGIRSAGVRVFCPSALRLLYRALV
jgi:hypothetical protein